MLLTIATTHQPATDLGFLLHKNPERVHSSTLSFGTATVVYPEASADRCTAALLVDVDPVGLVRGRRGPKGNDFSLDQYVNDRPYAASSFLSVAITKMYGTALGGRRAWWSSRSTWSIVARVASRSPASSAADASTCASSTAPSTPTRSS